MELGLREVVQIVSLVGTLLAAFAVVKSQLQRVIDDLRKLSRDVIDSEHRQDRTDSELSVLKMQTKVLADISSPPVLEKRNTELARVQAHIESLQQRVEHLLHMHNSTHPPQKT